MTPPRPTILAGDNLTWLDRLEDGSYDLIYVDPPFNTGRRQRRRRLRTRQDAAHGDRIGFGGRRYRSETRSIMSFGDSFSAFLEFLEPRLRHARRILKPRGSLFVHLDVREVHYCKVLLDELFGRASFKNEIIWAYDYGGRGKKSWPAKHDNILWYAKDPTHYTFHHDAVDRIPYMAPGLVGKEKAARGKVPTDVWWHTIVPTRSEERTGYPTQKPLGILNRILQVHSTRGDHVLDFFAGSGTTGEAAVRLCRYPTLIDNNQEAIDTMMARLSFANPCFIGGFEAADPALLGMVHGLSP